MPDLASFIFCRLTDQECLMITKLLIALFCLISVQEKQADIAPDKFTENWAAAYTTNDHQKLLSFYEQDDKLEVRMSSGVKVVGFELLKDLYESEFDQAEFIFSKAKSISIRKFDQTAIVSFEHVFGFKTEDEKAFEGHVQTVLVLRKSKETWKIVNEHSSTIKDVPRVKPIKN